MFFFFSSFLITQSPLRLVLSVREIVQLSLLPHIPQTSFALTPDSKRLHYLLHKDRVGSKGAGLPAPF